MLKIIQIYQEINTKKFERVRKQNRNDSKREMLIW